MGILFAHEMGHYLMCRYYGIDASLPYFIPIPGPFTLVGTMGAFIRIRGPFQHRSAWLQMGIAGPIAGFMVAVPVLIVGLGLSRFVPISLAETEGMYQMGEPLIFKLMAFVLGMTPPEGMTLLLHPIATAAWFGFLATGLNLIPAGQLDGGHVLYALFRERGHRLASFGLMAVLAPLGFVWFGWWIWLIFLTVIGFVFGFSHPPSLNDSIPLRRGDIWLGWIALALFILCFMPAPIELS
jgi:membrane-associated protease RseP (regulator of RpoE activity)